MNHKAISIRPFIGAKDFGQSRSFYADLGFQETVLSPVLSLFVTDGLGFYLQNAYNRDWVDNSMIFLEVPDAQQHWQALQALQLPAKYEGVRLVPVRKQAWGNECFVHDPAGILWHFGDFNK